MSNYLPRTRKKLERQERLETDLRRTIEKGASAEKLVHLAEEVRQVRIRTLRADRQHICILHATSTIDSQIEDLKNLPIIVILSEFGVQIDDVRDEKNQGSES